MPRSLHWHFSKELSEVTKLFNADFPVPFLFCLPTIYIRVDILSEMLFDFEYE